MKRSVLQFTLIQATLWAIIGGVSGFASRYLLGAGLTNTQAGFVLGVSTALSVGLQPAITGLVESRKVGLRQALAVLSVVIVVSLLAVPRLKNRLAVVLVFALANVAMGPMPAFVNALAMVSRRAGVDINFGVTRGLGSLTYGLAAQAANLCVARWGVQSIPMLGVVLAAALGLLILSYPAGGEMERQEKPTGLWSFFRENPGFTVFLLGNILINVGHQALGNCMYQVAAFKGDPNAQGTALLIAAVLEIPAMFLFSRLLRWKGSGVWVKLSSVFLALRIFLSLALPGVAGLYAAQIAQAAGYGIFAVATVQYADQVVAPRDVVKAQAYLGATGTTGSLIANFGAGVVLDAWGVPAMVLAATAIAGAGAVVMMFSVRAASRR